MKKLLKNSKPDGVHFLISLFGCEEEQINDKKFWKKILDSGIKKANIPVLKSDFYKFHPQGLTGFYLLASSHFSVHTWPEYNYLACDVFSCSPAKDTEKLVEFLLKNIKHKKAEIKKFKRGYKFFDFKKYINGNGQLVMPIFCNGEEMNIDIKEIIGKTKSDFQDILFIDTKKFGKCLVIDGIMQTSEKDHGIYDKSILKPLRKSDRKLLILGGGDGYVAEMALKINPKLEIKVIDLDLEVVRGCQKHLGQKVFSDSRVNLYVEDAFHYLSSTIKHNGKFDGVVCDLTDAPIMKKDHKGQKDFENFYNSIATLAKRALTDNGWISIQAGAAEVTSGHINAVGILEDLLKKRFRKVSRKNIMIPSFGEKNAFLYGKK